MARRELLSPEGFRLDGRRATELRHVSCQLGLDAKADGSALLCMGATTVAATVVGPHEVCDRVIELATTVGLSLP